MPIPASQCDVWQNSGATESAKAAHESVRNALPGRNSAISGRNFEVFLQGSYKNDTNIRGDSDVDIVVQFNDVFWHDLSALDDGQRQGFSAAYPSSPLSWDKSDADVQTTLRAYFGNERVTARNKCLVVSGASGRLDADVVVAAQYRRYKRFRSVNDEEFSEGITFWGRNDRRQVINYPKLHYANGTAKNQRAGGYYKRSVRMVKNARTYLVERNELGAATAPSYFVECWLFNVPDERFVADSSATFYNILSWLEENPDWSQFVCQNWEYYLFGPTPEQWTLDDAKKLHAALVKLWNSWNE